LEDKLRPLVFTGDESDEQPFVYHYKCNADNEFILGDGTDESVVTLLIISLLWLRNMFHNLFCKLFRMFFECFLSGITFTLACPVRQHYPFLLKL
jgi:hypothetical protein